MTAHHAADCTAVLGASSTGKGVYSLARARARGDRQALVWSPLEGKNDHYARELGGVLVQSIPQLVIAIKAGRRAIVFVPSQNNKLMRAQFDLFCRAAWHTPNGFVLIEELSRVTSASWAPGPWQNLSTSGRANGVSILATAQRPAQIDKDFLGNCTEIRSYRLNYPADSVAIAGIMREPAESFLDLPDLHYIHRNLRTRENLRGVQPIVGHQGARPAPAPKRKKKSA